MTPFEGAEKNERHDMDFPEKIQNIRKSHFSGNLQVFIF